MMFPQSKLIFFLELDLQTPPPSFKSGTGCIQPSDPPYDSRTIFFQKKFWNGQPLRPPNCSGQVSDRNGKSILKAYLRL